MMSCGSGNVSVSKNLIAQKGSNVAVLGFNMTDTKDNIKMPEISNEFSDAIAPYFMEAGFSVIERSRLKLLLKEQELQQTGLIDSDSNAIQLGKIARVRYVVFGSGRVNIAGSGNDHFLHSVSIKMVNVETGESVLLATWSGAGFRPAGVANKIGKKIVRAVKKKIHDNEPGH